MWFARAMGADLVIAVDISCQSFTTTLSCSSSTAWLRYRIALPSPSTWRPPRAPSGWSTQSGHWAGPQQVLEYLGRYTHRVAISNNRLLDFSDGKVAFAWKDYRHESQAQGNAP